MSVLHVETKSVNRPNVESETTETTYLPFKIGTIVNGVPIWLEARIPYSPKLEEMLYIREIIKHVFNKTVKLLEEKISLERSIPNKPSS